LASKIFVHVMVQEVQYTQRHPMYCSQEMRLFLLCISVFRVLLIFYVSRMILLPSSLYLSPQELQSVINSTLVGPSSSHS